MIKTEEIERKIYESTDKDLLKSIREHFQEKVSLKKENIKELNKLDRNAINLGLSRMEKVKEENDITGVKISIPIIVVILAGILTIINISFTSWISMDNLNEFIKLVILYLPTVIFPIIVLISINSDFKKSVKVKTTTNYFSVLLREIKEDNKNKIKEENKNEENKKSETVIIYTRYH